jgi:hypothetical protein
MLDDIRERRRVTDFLRPSRTPDDENVATIDPSTNGE